MTFEDRARTAGRQLGEWMPPESESGAAVERARRRVRRRRLVAAAASVVAVGAAVTVGLEAREDSTVVASNGSRSGSVAVQPRSGTTGVPPGFCRDRSDVVVYMNVDVAPADLDALSRDLHADRGVERVTYLDDQATFGLFQALYPEMEGADTVQLGDLPTSFRVVLAPGVDRSAFVTQVESRPGVYDATDQRGALPKLVQCESTGR